MNMLAFRRGFLTVGVLACLAALPLGVSAETNHAPVITSSAPTASIAGQTYQYSIVATDADANPLSYAMTIKPDGMILAGQTITWTPTKAGTSNVVVEVSDQHNGFATQAWQITVSAAPAAIIVISPNDNPTSVNLGNNQQFTATATDAFTNPVDTTGLTWSVSDTIGTVDTHGLFLANKAGAGSITATLGSAATTVSVTVKDIRSSLVTRSTNSTNTASGTAATTTTTNKNTNVNSNDNTNANEESISGTNDNTNTANDQQSDKPCTNMRHWIIVVLLFIYPIILIAYFMYEKRHRSGGWWLFPFFLTVIGLIIYYKYICSGTYLWWPWVLVGMGIALTWWYKGRRPSDHLDSQEKLPF